MTRSDPLGATVLADGRTLFRIWAPFKERVEVEFVRPVAAGSQPAGRPERAPLQRDPNGYHEAIVENALEGTRYTFVLDGVHRPDPASRSQPDGVHAPSEVIARDFEWHDQAWRGVELEDLVVYELHVGTFTEAGTFDAAIERLDVLKDLGITVIELMPIAQFPGARNWGYDGTYIGAAQSTYGGPRALKRLVDACHTRGIALFLDVVYNHLGPEGNYIAGHGPYFTDRYKTPWGPALNFDGPFSDDVRWFFIHNALMWVDEFHVDGLRIDAVHAIVDHSAEPFLQDLTTAVRARATELGRKIWTIAESDLNDPRVIMPKDSYGLGFDSQWNDDFHHSLHTLLTGEQDGYYEGFGRASDLGRVMTGGYLFTGQYSTYRRRKYGAKPNTKDGAKFMVFAQNHDQIGNRMAGERLSALVPYDKLKIAAAAVVLSPFLPMLFMGEEYGEKAPFQYFTSHSDADLIEAVRRGRIEELDDFAWVGEPPDPHDVETFERSRLDWSLRARGGHASLWRVYRELLRLRRSTPSLRSLDLSKVETHADDEWRILLVRRDQALIAFNFDEKAHTIELPFAPAAWRALIDTGAKIEVGRITLPPNAFALFGV